MKNDTYNCVIHFPQCSVGLRIVIGVRHPEAGVSSQPHIALWTFKSCPGLFFAEHTPHRICLPF